MHDDISFSVLLTCVHFQIGAHFESALLAFWILVRLWPFSAAPLTQFYQLFCACVLVCVCVCIHTHSSPFGLSPQHLVDVACARIPFGRILWILSRDLLFGIAIELEIIVIIHLRYKHLYAQSGWREHKPQKMISKISHLISRNLELMTKIQWNWNENPKPIWWALVVCTHCTRHALTCNCERQLFMRCVCWWSDDEYAQFFLFTATRLSIIFQLCVHCNITNLFININNAQFANRSFSTFLRVQNLLQFYWIAMCYVWEVFTVYLTPGFIAWKPIDYQCAKMRCDAFEIFPLMRHRTPKCRDFRQREREGESLSTLW